MDIFKDNDMENYLMRLYRALSGSQPAPEIVGQGMAAQGVETIQSLPYRRYAQEQQAMGMQPLPPQEWMAQNQQPQQRTAY